MLKVALCQLSVGADKAANIANAVSRITAAAKKGAKLVVLPECFNSPYGTSFFPEYAEPVPHGETCTAMAACAKANGIFLVAGSMPERAPSGDLYNTMATFSPSGSLIGVYRKMHLFRLNTDKLKFDEGETLTAGDEYCTVDVGNGFKAGMGICFDARFPQFAAKYTSMGTNVLIYPGAFNMVTGPPHWQLTAKARAIDNQQYVLFCSPARDETAGYVAYGHSVVIDPWGKVLAEAGAQEDTIFAELDAATVAETRGALPILSGMRPELYAA
eukprot:TRINITY_DN4751_c0_g1_i1.p1 TRINITY_DN4751_c0_g1~~TRINITY_DN4751_c0_g1_i1.p1  ORF type:complete len:272 (+),score=63.95 TRINITY_DN4751_c0_g1_i1:69-884(+)